MFKVHVAWLVRVKHFDYREFSRSFISHKLTRGPGCGGLNYSQPSDEGIANGEGTGDINFKFSSPFWGGFVRITLSTLFAVHLNSAVRGAFFS